MEVARQENKRVLTVEDQPRKCGDFEEMRRPNTAGASPDDLASDPKPHKGRVISIVSPLGGEGRTTLCTNFSAALARLGKETTAVDADIVQRRLGMVMGLENRIPYSLADVLKKACGLSKACVRHEDISGLQLLSMGSHVKDTAVMQHMKPDPDFMRWVCEHLPPGCSGPPLTDAIAAADHVIVVEVSRWHAVHTATRLVENVSLLSKRDMRLVINRMRPKSRRDHDGMPDASKASEILQRHRAGKLPRHPRRSRNGASYSTAPHQLPARRPCTSVALAGNPAHVLQSYTPAGRPYFVPYTVKHRRTHP